MRNEQVTLLATSGTTSDRLQVIWEWSWWDPQEREAMRLNGRIASVLARPEYREAVLTTPACGAGTCHIGSQTAAERSIDGILFLNENADPTHWTDGEYDRMLSEWREFAPLGIEADPAYLAILARAALARRVRLPAPQFITLTYETTTRAMRRDICRAFDAPVFQLYGATECGVLFMECEHGRLHPNERHSHVDLVPLPGAGRLARVLVTTLGRAWMPLLRYDIGDVVRVAESRDCACGLKSDGPLLERVEGRQSDCVGVGGATITPLMLDDAIHEALGPEATIEQWQLAGDDLLVVDHATDRSAARAAAAVGAVLARTIRGERVAAIAPEASGKYRLVKR
jgi:phenylacetate-CoA ligase